MRHAAILAAAVLLAATGALPAQVTEPQAERLSEAERLLRAGESDRAVAILEPLTEQHPTLAEAHRLLGHVYARAGRFDDARAAFTTSLSHGRVTADILAGLVEVDRARGNDFAVANSLRWLAVLEPADVAYALLAAQSLHRTGETAAAVAIAEAAADRDPANPDALRLLGGLRLESGDPPAALEPLTTAYRLAEPDPTLARTIAELHHQTGDDAQAIAWYRRALAEHDDPAWSLRLAELLVAEGEHADAVDRLTRLTGSDAVDRATVQRWLGYAHRGLGDDARALAAWRAALDEGLRDTQALRYVVAEALEAGDTTTLARGLPLLRKASPPTLAATQLLAAGHLRLDQPDAATTAITAYVEHHGLDPHARRLLTQLANPAPPTATQPHP